MASTSTLEELAREDLVLLARHVCRVSGSISLKTLNEYLPDLTFETTLHILESLVESGHVRREKPGRYAFVDSTGEVEIGELEEELRVLANLKQSVVDRNRTNAASENLLHGAVEVSVQENPDSGEESTARRKHHGFKSSREFNDATLEHGKSRRRQSHTSASTLGIPINIDKIRKLSLDESLFSSGHLKAFHQSTPDSRKFKHVLGSPRSMARRRSSLDHRRGPNSDSDEDSEKSIHSPPPELNKTIYPEDETQNSDFASFSRELTACIHSIPIDSTDETPPPEPVALTAAGSESSLCGLASGMAALDLGSVGEVLPAASRNEIPEVVRSVESPSQAEPTDASSESTSAANLSRAIDTKCSQDPTSCEIPPEIPLKAHQGVSTSEPLPEAGSSPVGIKSEAAKPEDSGQPDEAKEALGEVIDDPCRALEVYCECLNLSPPSYDLTYMSIDRVFYSSVLVRKIQFLSYPTKSMTEEGAREIAARKALKSFGITASMVAGRVFPNPRRKVREERHERKAQVSHAEP